MAWFWLDRRTWIAGFGIFGYEGGEVACLFVFLCTLDIWTAGKRGVGFLSVVVWCTFGYWTFGYLGTFFWRPVGLLKLIYFRPGLGLEL